MERRTLEARVERHDWGTWPRPRCWSAAGDVRRSPASESNWSQCCSAPSQRSHARENCRGSAALLRKQAGCLT